MQKYKNATAPCQEKTKKWRRRMHAASGRSKWYKEGCCLLCIAEKESQAMHQNWQKASALAAGSG
jgi:hypothetical protein